MATNEILFWAMLGLAWALSLMAAYYHGKVKAFEASRKIARKIVSEAVEQKLDELKNQHQIR